MKDWNIIVTTPPGQERELLPALNQFGEFTRSDFPGLLVGRVEEVPRFLEDIRHAGEEHAEWRQYLLRVLPVERTFAFPQQTFEERVREAVTPFVQRLAGDTLHGRLERRGHRGTILSPAMEQRVGEYVLDLATQQGKTLHVSFQDQGRRGL